jgi:cell fate (sporulation/competence/biofilm development) regulator YmcA (YheA/YmcA/DUF963 family)
MCDKCKELDGEIEDYRRISESINDQLTIDRIQGLIDEVQNQKIALHLDRKD